MSNPSITIFVNVQAGTDIKDAATEALHIANLLQCWVEFEFNDVDCLVAPNSSPADLAEKYSDAVKDKGPYRQRRTVIARGAVTVSGDA